ncbi:MAG: type II 3-dehydroquinate dehydratase [Bacilli bacterium]
MKLLIINGPNLNMLGIREKNIYGSKTIKDLKKYIRSFAKDNNIHVSFYFSNSEGKLVSRIQKAYQKVDGIVINPGAYTHYSIAILDALKAINVPYVEVHLSDIDNREEFRKHSITGLNSLKIIKGLQFDSYIEGIKVLKKHLEK